MATLQVDVVSAERSLFSGEAKFVALPGEVGELGISPGHTPLITRIRPGTVKIVHKDDNEEHIFVAGGGLEVQPNQVTVLADTALRAGELDESKALTTPKRAEEALEKLKNKDENSDVPSALESTAA